MNHFCIKGGRVNNLLLSLEEEIDKEHQRKIEKNEFSNETDKSLHNTLKSNLKEMLFSLKNLLSFVSLPKDIIRELKDKQMNHKDIIICLAMDFDIKFKKIFTLGSYAFYMHFIKCVIPISDRLYWKS